MSPLARSFAIPGRSVSHALIEVVGAVPDDVTMGSSSQFVLGGVSAVEDVGAAGLGEAVPGPVDERFDPGPVSQS